MGAADAAVQIQIPVQISGEEHTITITIDTNNPDATSAEDAGSATAQAPLDLTQLTNRLRGRMNTRVPISYLRGKTRMRDEVMDMLDCSALHAEHVVDSMVARGYACFRRHGAFVGDPRYGVWKLQPSP